MAVAFPLLHSLPRSRCEGHKQLLRFLYSSMIIFAENIPAMFPALYAGEEGPIKWFYL